MAEPVRMSGWRRLALRVAAAPRWVLIVALVVASGAASIGYAIVDVAQRGFVSPALFAGGIAATFGISFVYVTVVQKGEVLEAIDLTEAPVIALALVLPPGEMILAVALGSIVGQLRARRSIAKKAFNVGVPCTGAAVLQAVVSLTGQRTAAAAGSVPAVLVGAALYTALGALAVAAVVASVQGEGILGNLTNAWRARGAAWVAAAAIGVAAAATVLHDPWALAGLVGALALVRYTTRSLQREQQERHRLECLVEATSSVLDAQDEWAQEAAVLDAARKLLLWRDVWLRDGPPSGDEAGALLWRVGAQSRWLVACRRPGADPWTDDDRRVLEALSAAAATAYERARMQQELVRHAKVDPLTGLANRREFDARADEALAGGGAVGVILLDLDGFKPVNDSLGHDAGDELLRVVGRRLTEVVRTTDLVARIGGDEFVVLLPGATEAATDRLIRDLREAVSEPVQVGDWRLVVTASAGAAVAPSDGSRRPELLRAADQRMYEAKRAQHRRSFLAVSSTDERAMSS